MEQRDCDHAAATPASEAPLEPTARDGTDLESGRAPTPERDTSKEEQQQDANLVAWDGPDDPENPKNWSPRQKWALTVLVSLFTFISPVSSSMIAPALGQVGEDLGMQSGGLEMEMALSIFVLGYAVGPLLFGPASEVFGRARVLKLSNVFYIAWNTGCEFARSKGEMFVFRFLAGVGGSAPLAVGGGMLSDVWTPDQRGRAVGVYSLAPILGPVVGPMAAGFIAQYSTWRWVFWSTSIAAAVVEVLGLVWLRETHGPTLLSRKRDRLARETGNEKLHTGPGSDKTLAATIKASLVRPARMLATQPIVQVVSLYIAYLFGLMYLIMVTYPAVWGEVYHEPLGVAGLNYMSMGIGSVAALFVSFFLIDRIYAALKKRNGGKGAPEFRVPAMMIGSVLIPAGLLWYGWSVEARAHWVVPNVGIALVTGGSLICLQGMMGYTIDAYSRYAASAIAASTVLRSLAGFAFPLFAPYLYERLSYGWGSTVLAAVGVVIGIPAPLMFYFVGARLRGVSKYAAG